MLHLSQLPNTNQISLIIFLCHQKIRYILWRKTTVRFTSKKQVSTMFISPNTTTKTIKFQDGKNSAKNAFAQCLNERNFPPASFCNRDREPLLTLIQSIPKPSSTPHTNCHSRGRRTPPPQRAATHRSLLGAATEKQQKPRSATIIRFRRYCRCVFCDTAYLVQRRARRAKEGCVWWRRPLRLLVLRR